MSTLRPTWVASLPDLAGGDRHSASPAKQASLVARLQRILGLEDLRLVSDAAEKADVTVPRGGGRSRTLGGLGLVSRAADQAAGL